MRKTSKQTFAYDASQEYPYTWVEILSQIDYPGVFFKTADAAKKAADENYHNFKGGMSSRQVLVIKVVDTLGDA